MRALVCREFGHTDDLVVEERNDPVPGPGEVVVDVQAAGINFPDVLVVAGKYQVKTPPPFIAGNEAAGVVSGVGDGVTRFSKGDKVIVMSRGGAFAEKMCERESSLVPLPDGLDFVSGAGIGVTIGTSYHALKQCARLQSGESLLVLGAAGGVGIAAVEIGKAMGAHVIAAASSDEKLEFAREAGADDLINYSEHGLRDALRELTGDDGVDVVYDPVGGDLAGDALRSLAWHGRYLVVGFASGDIPQFPANIALLKEASIVGVWWGTWCARHPDELVQNLQEIGALLASGRVQPRITEVFALDDYKKAFRMISERRVRGKIVFDMNQSSNG